LPANRVFRHENRTGSPRVATRAYGDQTRALGAWLRGFIFSLIGWPLFLPVCIAAITTLYGRKTACNSLLISAAKARNIAFEINDMSHTPIEQFIRMAKVQGLKFRFGSDSRNKNAGRLAYCKRIAKTCNLKADDFFVPVRKTVKQ
jgi:hypothetical protein